MATSSDTPAPRSSFRCSGFSAFASWKSRVSQDVVDNISCCVANVTPPNGAADVAIAAVAASPSACESRTQGLENSSFSFLLANVQGFVSKSADLVFC